VINLGCIDLNQWYARCDDVDRPDYLHFDLDPVKGTRFEKVTEARARAIAAGTVQEQGQAENMLTQALRSLFAVAEAYPQLRATENFQRLQEDLTDTESKIAFSRQFYNDSVLMYDNLRQSFPASVIAGFGGFAPRQYFEAETASREPVKVQF